ncbi:putative motility protein [Nitratiruptor sp. SB155-2]|uniref:putative motility protein n=1 Tax=Nitratiruptor sp. (strain SB155-2) TaxID=387092 RepID=UPI0003054B1F|nr:YjfB family protein [Nitratiruptor sp. SB155-2]
MNVSSVNDIAAYSIWQKQQSVKNHVEVSMLKKAMQLQQEMMQKMLEGIQQTSGAKTPPPNPNGTISLYA